MTVADPAATTALTYGKSRRRALVSWRDYPALARLLLEAVAIAFGVAMIVFVSLAIAPVPVTLVLGLTQGAIVGGLLGLSFRRARARLRPLPLLLGVTAGAGSAALVYFGLYLREAWSLQTQFGVTASLPQNLLSFLGFGSGFHAIPLLSSLTVADTGHSGFLGYLLWRVHRSPNFLNLPIAHTLITAFLAWRVVRSQVAAPFCPACAEWLGPAKNAAVVPTWLLGELAAAVRNNDPARAVDVTRQAAGKDLGTGCAIARVRRCPSCQGAYAEVVVKSSTIAGRGMQTHESAQLPATAISEETFQALRSEPALPVPEPESPPPAPET